MRVIFIGDLVGGKAARAAAAWTAEVKKKACADFVIINAENAAGGRGLKRAQAAELLEAGADVLTLGNHAWGSSSLMKHIKSEERILRPGNVPAAWPGRSSLTVEKDGMKLRVLCLLGQVYMRPYLSPFAFAEDFLAEQEKEEEPVPLLIDFHAEATAEKQAFAAFCDGRAALVLGTHTHVQTADERILPGGTGYISDVGMTGPFHSVIGMHKEASLRRFTEQLPTAYRLADGPMILSAVLADIDRNGRCRYIKRIQIREEEAASEHADYAEKLPELPDFPPQDTGEGNGNQDEENGN